MDLQSLLIGRLGVGLSVALGQITPERWGYRLVDSISRQVVRNPDRVFVKATRANQWVISGETLTAEQLDERTLNVFRSIGCSLFDFYHNLHHPEKLLRMVEFSITMDRVLAERQSAKRGVIFITPHTSAFDLGGAALARRGLCYQTLSFPKVNDGYAWQNKIRRELGLEVTPLSMVSLQQARERLNKGGTVLSGLDRPHPGSNYRPRFFGKPAALPVFHVRLGLKTHSPIIVVAVNTLPDGKYLLDCSEEIWMQPDPDPQQEIIINAEKVLQVGEPFIRNHPEQWAMTYPVWPEVVDVTP